MFSSTTFPYSSIFHIYSPENYTGFHILRCWVLLCSLEGQLIQRRRFFKFLRQTMIQFPTVTPIITKCCLLTCRYGSYLLAVNSVVNISIYVVCVWVWVVQSCWTLCVLMDFSLPDSSVHGILQARILKWAAISFSRGSSQPRDPTWVSCIAGKFLIVWATREDFQYMCVCV